MKKNIHINKSQTTILTLPEGDSVYDYQIDGGISCSIVVLSLNQKKVHTNISVHLQGKDASATILGLVVAKHDANIYMHTMQYHEAPDTTSNLLVKTALWDNAVSSVEGGIRVDLGAQKTNAYQRNENLLLSKTAVATSKPSLEILANDVRCTHGATMGPISQEELWYLSTRGIPKHIAEPLIISGFFQKGIDTLTDTKMKESLSDSIANAV